jgi:hypothetical protein
MSLLLALSTESWTVCGVLTFAMVYAARRA